MASMLKVHKHDPQGQQWREKAKTAQKPNHSGPKFNNNILAAKKG